MAGLARLGFLANFISEPVLKGFIIGLALTIIVGQLPKLFGIDKVDGDFFDELFGFLGGLSQTHLPTLIVGVVSLAIVIGLKEVAPVVPGSLVAVGFGIAAVWIFGLDQIGIAIVGPIQAGLPTFGLPSLALSDYLELMPRRRSGVALVGFAEGLGAAKTYAARNHYDIDSNRELLGLGAANVASGLSGGMVVNGSLSKTAVNGGAGARTQLSGLVVAVMTVITLLFLTGLFEKLPEATLAAVVIAALVELVDIRSLRRFYGLTNTRLGRIYGVAARPDFIAATAALFGVLIFDTLPGLFIGIVVSIILLVYRTSRPHVAVLGRVPGTTDQFADIERHTENRPVARRRHPATGEQPVLRQRRPGARRDPGGRRRARHARRRPRPGDRAGRRPDRGEDARGYPRGAGRPRPPAALRSRRRAGPRHARHGGCDRPGLPIGPRRAIEATSRATPPAAETPPEADE